MNLKDLKNIIKEEIQKLQETENELGHSQGKCPDGMFFAPSSDPFAGDGYCYTLLDVVPLGGIGQSVQGKAPMKKNEGMGGMAMPNSPNQRKRPSVRKEMNMPTSNRKKAVRVGGVKRERKAVSQRNKNLY